MNEHEWTTALKSFAQKQREAVPIPDRNSLKAEEEWRCRIIGGDFMDWQQGRLRAILEQRSVSVETFDPEPLIIFTTTMPGLVAAREIMPSPPDNLICVLHDEFVAWEKQNPPGIFYIHHWSYFQRPDGVLLARAQEAYPGVEAAEYRVHSSGDLWGEQCGEGTTHLWRWRGNDMELLKGAFSHIVF